MPTKAFISSILTLSLCLFLQSTAYAEVYKWVDEKGQVNYSDHPGNTEAEQVTIRDNETTKPRIIKKAEADENNSKDKNTAEESVKLEPPKISKKERRRLCNEAKNDIAAISSRGRMREINKKGEYIYLSEQQRQQRLSTARKKQAKFCR
jgi:hypothetical protein